MNAEQKIDAANGEGKVLEEKGGGDPVDTTITNREILAYSLWGGKKDGHKKAYHIVKKVLGTQKNRTRECVWPGDTPFIAGGGGRGRWKALHEKRIGKEKGSQNEGGGGWG